MDWMQAVTIIGTNIALFLWSRSESRSDYRMIRSLVDAIHSEMKDFHARLSVEENKKKRKR